MSALAYFKEARAVLDQVAETQGPAIARAADLLCDTIAAGRAIFSFGASHSFMTTEELVYRTGGLMLVNPIYPQGMNLLVRPITLTSRLERLPGLGRELLAGSAAKDGDTLLLTSTSGRNAVIIDMALAARERQMPIIGLTALAYSEGVTSRHPSGKKLLDLCDVVIDNGAPLGDAAVSLPGLPQKIGPLSSLTGIAIVNAMMAETVALLLARGIEPPVFMSANLDGGDAWNARLLAANAHRIHYLA